MDSDALFRLILMTSICGTAIGAVIGFTACVFCFRWLYVAGEEALRQRRVNIDKIKAELAEAQKLADRVSGHIGR